jgi:hypothetical protein
MKKMFAFFAILSALVSCDIDKENNFSTITNNSDYAVTVTDERAKKVIIPAGESKSVEWRGAGSVKNNFTTQKPNRAQFIEDSFAAGHFINADPYALYISNLTLQEIILTADDYIDQEPLPILSSEIGTTRYAIFTSSPVFEAETKTGLSLSCSYTYDKETKMVRVVVQ